MGLTNVTSYKAALYRANLLFRPSTNPSEFVQAKLELKNAMELVAEELSKMWNNERYVRADLDSNIQ